MSSNAVAAPTANAFAGATTAGGVVAPQVGQHYLQALEQGDGTNLCNINAPNQNFLFVQLKL